MVLATIEVNTSAAQNVFAASIPTSPTFQKAEYSKSWHNLEQSNLCCNLADDQSLDIKLNPYATKKHKPKGEKLSHCKSQEYFQSRCGRNSNAKGEKQKHDKSQEDLNDHLEERKLLQIQEYSIQMQQKVTTQTQRRKTTLQISRNLILDHYDERKPLQISSTPITMKKEIYSGEVLRISIQMWQAESQPKEKQQTLLQISTRIL